MYLDQNGLIVQQNEDAGDQLQREGFWEEGMYLNTSYPRIEGMTDYQNALQFLNTPNGLVRSWAPGGSTPPWNDPDDCSRDQIVSNVRACGYYGITLILKQILLRTLKNFSRYQNGDVAFFQDYARFIRAFKNWWLLPLCLVFDLQLFIGVIVRCIQARNSDDVGDDINLIGDLAQAQQIFGTPLSYLARKIYVKFRPSFSVTGGLVTEQESLGAYWALTWYFRSESGGNPEFADLWIPIVQKF